MGIQVSGLLSNSAFDWKSVVDQLMTIEGAPVTKLTAEKTKNADQITALASIKASFQELQDSVQAMRADEVFSSRGVVSDVVGTTWKSNSANGAPLGSYKLTVQQLATAAAVRGSTDIGSGLSATADVSGLTLANLRTGSAVTAGSFTVNGKQVAVALTDSLQDVFTKISAATGGTVTASYNPSTDGIGLVSSSGNVVLGAANDTSNFLTVAKLANNGSNTVGSAGSLGTLKVSGTLAAAGLRTGVAAPAAPGGVGAFSINGVSIAYDMNADSLGALLSRISKSGAGVSASYDPLADRVVLTNQKTGDVGLNLSEDSNGLLAALGVTGGSATTVSGKNAQFRLNDGEVLTSASNTLEASSHGIDGLSVTVNSESTQTVTIESDAAGMHTAIQGFIGKYNTLQDLIESHTKVEVSGTTVTGGLLANNHEVEAWAKQLRALAFAPVSGVTGNIGRLDDLGIDFDGITGHLAIKNADKLSSALASNPDDLKAFFIDGPTSFVTKMYDLATVTKSWNAAAQETLAKASTNIDKQITQLQARLVSQRELLTNSFLNMLDAQSKASNMSTYLTNHYFNKSSN